MERKSTDSLRAVSDDDLLRRLHELVAQSRRVEADLVAHIGEVDQRKLYSRFAFPSMFAYCTAGLHLSEAEAYRRITAARAVREHGVLLEMLRDGRLHLSGITQLVPILTAENRNTVLRRATHRSKRELEELVAELSPRPDVPSGIRRLPERPMSPSPVGSRVSPPPMGDVEQPAAELFPGRVETKSLESPSPAPSPAPSPVGARGVVEPLSAGRYKVQFTASAALRDKIERLAALLHADGDVGAVIERAVSETLERLEARRLARTAVPRKTLAGTDTSPASRHVPAAVRRAVSERDGNRCHFVDEHGRRCSEQHRLEFHHRHPFGRGGNHSPENITLLCSAHNRAMAEHDYGQAAVRRRGPAAAT